ELLKSYLPKNAVVIDIGANIGMFPIRLLVDQPDIRFYSYEPFPNNFAILHKNVAASSFTQNRISIFNMAVLGKKQDNLKIYFNKKEEYTDSSSLIPGFENNHDALPISSTTLEEIIKVNGLQKIDLLKLYCEGSEYSILYDSPIDLINSIPFIVVETHDLDNEKNNLQGVKTFLGSLGFTFKTRSITGKINMVWAWK
ncbi:MAG: FkbM family methyltransferase, partial [Chitinophagaceae bacterium]